ncbi:Fc.00g074580.m01.CDS01 [Cosmosporella sp. VM-42]
MKSKSAPDTDSRFPERLLNRSLMTISPDNMFSPRFLVISLGNPLPKYESLHSAGHFALNGLAKVLRHPEFQQVTFGKQKCLISRGPKYTLIQSPTLMNVSGGFVVRAWQEMIKEHDPVSLSLVIVHDELEKDLGVVRLTAWDRSHKGHNGLKSVRGSVSQAKYPESPFCRIAVGIGRPKERDPATVSRYVLGQISGEQRRILEEEAPWKVAEKLVELENEWKTELEPTK